MHIDLGTPSKHVDLVTLMEAAVSAEEFDHVNGSLAAPSWVRAYEAVSAVVSDDHNFERGVGAARAVADRVLAEAGPAGLTEMALELSLRLAEALKRASRPSRACLRPTSPRCGS